MPIVDWEGEPRGASPERSDAVSKPDPAAAGPGLIERILEDAPSPRVLDLGCGEGRHARALAARGCEVVAIDAAESTIERARARDESGTVEFLVGEMGAVEGFVRGQFGVAICLGNTLPHLLTAESLSRMLVGLRRRLLPGGSLVIEVLNYDRILESSIRALPVDFFASPEGERIVLRHLGLLSEDEAGILLHTTTTLRHRPASSPPVEVVASSQVQLRAWRRGELEILLETARWSDRQAYADLEGSAFEPEESAELVLVAR